MHAFNYLQKIDLRADLLSYPSTVEILLQFMFFILFEDATFYWFHRLFHIPFLYKHFHKQHHEYNISLGIGAEYTHPFEYIFITLIPVGGGSSLLGNKCHVITSLLWGIYKYVEAVDVHCGYDFPWSPYRILPLTTSADYHGFHHSHNIGNFGICFSFWDTVCGTNKHYWRYLSKKLKLN